MKTRRRTSTARGRLDFVRRHGYLASFLPVEGASAYAEMRDATRKYEEAGRLTPLQERTIRESIRRTPVDYRVRELSDDQRYDIGSLVLPVRDRNGAFTLTLRLAQLPPQSTGATIKRWLDDARSIVAILENGGTQG